MIRLRTRGDPRHVGSLMVGIVTRIPPGSGKILFTDTAPGSGSGEMPLAIVTRLAAETENGWPNVPLVSNVQWTDHLEEGAIVAIQPSGRIDTLFRPSSPHNTLFVTERCNSACLMCSQPPRDVDDIAYYYDLNCRLLDLVPPATPTLGMTGGEPTLLGARFIDLLARIRSRLPQTKLEILTNGRAFANCAFASAVGEVATPRVLFSIPLYSDFPPQHDFVVQAPNAFVETVRGLHELARSGCRVEIRVVLHRQTADRLTRIAQFIHKNLTFVEHVAFMGMEHIGYARSNEDLLWMEPSEYVGELARAIDYLETFGFPSSIYNLQPCLLPTGLWPNCRSSISDWKREYLPECNGCDLRSSCGGVFGTSARHSSAIRAVTL